jgi:integrase
LITGNPAKARKIREIFAEKQAPTRRALFTDDELNAIFYAPLYLGCEDDEKNYARPGTQHPRRGRFWVPLLGLFQGLRCNEACQLYAEDIKEETGIPCIQVREGLDDTRKSDKRVKNRASWRTIPIHPELLRIGFLEFARARQASGPAQRLFPELHAAKNTGRYSHIFSKWFGRYLVSACGHKPKATFHSFRHHFRTALMNARVSKELSEALGGWKSESSSEYEYRHAQLPTLRAAIEKVLYPDLDLTHLSRKRGSI